MGSYYKGNTLHLTSKWTDPLSGNALTNPFAVRCKVKDPQGNVVTYTDVTTPAVGHDGLGLFHLDVTPAPLEGNWWYRFEALDTLGNVIAASEQTFFIARGNF